MEEREKTIKDFLIAMTTQNNRSTAHPYYFVIRTPEYIQSNYSGDDPDGQCDRGRTVYCFDEDCSQMYNSRAELKASLIEDSGLTGHEADSAIENEYTQEELVLIWRETGMFFTQTDADNHLKANHYHYPQGSHTYVKHAWRAPELEGFFDALFKHFGIEKTVPKRPPV